MGLTDLIGAVASYITECGGAPTKTKVLKLLYLLDIEAFRRTQKTLTGFDWIFYLYGPWAASYDDALSAAADTNKIRVALPEPDNEGATFINPAQKLPLSAVFPNVVQELTAKRIIEAWASRPTVELLDYVYFHTAPMRDAKRGAALDFSTVIHEEKLPHYSGVNSKAEKKEVAQKRRQFLEGMKSVRKAQIMPLDPAPQYDEKYWSSVNKLESELD